MIIFEFYIAAPSLPVDNFPIKGPADSDTDFPVFSFEELRNALALRRSFSLVSRMHHSIAAATQPYKTLYVTGSTLSSLDLRHLEETVGPVLCRATAHLVVDMKDTKELDPNILRKLVVIAPMLPNLEALTVRDSSHKSVLLDCIDASYDLSSHQKLRSVDIYAHSVRCHITGGVAKLIWRSPSVREVQLLRFIEGHNCVQRYWIKVFCSTFILYLLIIYLIR